VSTIPSCDGRLQQAKCGCKEKGDTWLGKKTPHRLFQADGGLKEGNGIGEPYAHLAHIYANMVPRKYKKEDLISFKMFGEQALKKLAIIRGDMCKLYTNTET
jgi:hypothetical protein